MIQRSINFFSKWLLIAALMAVVIKEAVQS